MMKSGSWVSALVAQLAEHILGKDEVTGSIPVKGSSIRFFGCAVKIGP